MHIHFQLLEGTCTRRGSLIDFFGIQDFSYLKLGIRDLEKKGARFGIESMLGRGMPKITLGITGFKTPIGDPPY